MSRKRSARRCRARWSFGTRSAKDKTLRRDAACQRGAAQVLGGPAIVPEQPEHAALDRREEAHPDIESRDVIFQLLLKQQKTKPSSGRPASARVGARLTGSLAVVDLIGIRQVGDLLGIEPLALPAGSGTRRRSDSR